MLKLFNKNATSFKNLGLGILTDFTKDPLITEVLNGEYNLEFTYKKDGKLFENLVEENIVVANGQAFRIINIKKTEKEVKILAKHIFFDLKKNFLEDVAPTNKTAQAAIDWILGKTEYKNNFIVTGDCSKVTTARYVRKNPIDAIYNEENAVLKKFGGELEFDNYNVKVHSKRGKNLNLEIRQGKNVNGVEYNLDFSTVVTRIMPKGKDELLLPQKYVDSSLINNYFQPLISLVEFNNIEDIETLKNETEKLFEQGIDKPIISVKIDFIELSKTEEYKKYMNLETAHLGDTCKVYIPAINLNTTVRIVKTEYNCNLNRITKLELGSVTPNISTSTNKIQNTVDKMPSNLLTQAKKEATDMLNHPFNRKYIYRRENGNFIFNGYK